MALHLQYNPKRTVRLRAIPANIPEAPAIPKEERKEEECPDKSVDIVGFNVATERRFVQLVSVWLNEHETMSIAQVIQDAAYDLNISTETARRYVLKFTATHAPYQTRAGQIMFR